MACGTRSKCCTNVLVLLTFIAFSLLIAGIIVAALGSFTTLVDDEIKKNLPLKEGSTSFDKWKDSDGEQLIKYFFFNITDTGNSTTVPRLKEFGPYTYKKTVTTNVTKRLGQTLTFFTITRYNFDKSRSCAGCDPFKDRFTTVNYPLLALLRGVGARLQLQNASTAQIRALQTASLLQSTGVGLFRERSVQEYLWGYKDTALGTVFQQLTRQLIPGNIFPGVQSNNSEGYVTKIHTGESDVNRVTEVLEWRNYTKLPFWNSDSSNMINGTNGRRFKPFLEKHDTLNAFIKEICRSLRISYDSSTSVRDIDLYRYIVRKEELLNGNVNPNNKGFCVTGPTKACLPTGLLDVMNCRGGSTGTPFIASTPHFYDGDPKLSELFDLKPDKEKHGTYVAVEPNTGITMQGHLRLQLNFPVSKSQDIPRILLNNVSDILYIPVFYTDDFAEISEEDADDFKTNVLLPKLIAEAMPYVMIGLGALLLLIAVVILIVCRSSRAAQAELSGSGGKDNFSMK
ncbi:lysosome membrane protein 2-like [Xenia sp. Carnegie-2017]|uniref:lysosome membrane protein 2-like n=1 Tax=Xenia sp. Carnegie-2017 TaxID=2897299 RepID=UPI001F040532|nr:lysosome membrane protein 2-like [Xenia sp. Carnegie-2017]